MHGISGLRGHLGLFGLLGLGLNLVPGPALQVVNPLSAIAPWPEPEPESAPRLRPWEMTAPHPEGPCRFRPTGNKRTRRRRAGRRPFRGPCGIGFRPCGDPLRCLCAAAE